MPKKLIEKVEENVEVTETADSNDGIVVRDPQILRPVDLPLVITLPEGASKAQIEFVKTLNGYAYKNPEKFALKKDDRVLPSGVVIKGLITKLKELKNAPDPIESNLKYGKQGFTKNVM
jgi:hypothetical protein